jgi:hypothetical protein
MLADPDTGNPAAYLPALATSLNNLGAFLSRLEPRQDGLAAAQEAVDIRRVLADPDTGNPAVYLPDLAMSLASRAIVLQGQDAGAAVASMEEAVHVWSALADQIPDAFGPLLRRGLTSLVDLLEGAGRDEEAAKVRELLTHTG